MNARTQFVEWDLSVWNVEIMTCAFVVELRRSITRTMFSCWLMIPIRMLELPNVLSGKNFYPLRKLYSQLFINVRFLRMYCFHSGTFFLDVIAVIFTYSVRFPQQDPSWRWKGWIRRIQFVVLAGNRTVVVPAANNRGRPSFQVEVERTAKICCCVKILK